MKKSTLFVCMLLMKVLDCAVVVAMDDFRRGFEQFQRDGGRSVGAYMEEQQERRSNAINDHLIIVARQAQIQCEHDAREREHEALQRKKRRPVAQGTPATAAMGHSDQVEKTIRRCDECVEMVGDGCICCCQECVWPSLKLIYPCLKEIGTCLGTTCIKSSKCCIECCLQYAKKCNEQ